MVEQHAEFRSPFRLFFVDFEKALDRVNRECIWNGLRRKYVAGKLIAIVIRCIEVKFQRKFEIQSGELE